MSANLITNVVRDGAVEWRESHEHENLFSSLNRNSEQLKYKSRGGDRYRQKCGMRHAAVAGRAHDTVKKNFSDGVSLLVPCSL